MPPALQFYEVDSRAEVVRKKAALDAVVPGWHRAAQRPRFVEGKPPPPYRDARGQGLARRFGHPSD